MTPRPLFHLDKPRTAAQRAAVQLVLSLFPGADLLGRGFEAEGFCVVRGPDLVWGGDVREFHAPRGKFSGIVMGSPCQEFSRERRLAPVTGYGLEMLQHARRIVLEGRPDWWLLENVIGVPDVEIPGYTVQRFLLRANECGGKQLRIRKFQFGSRDASQLVCDRAGTVARRELVPAPIATEIKNRRGRRSFADFCELQGLPRTFDLPGLSLAAKYRAVGNGVPVYMARVLARAVKARRNFVGARLCPCLCGRVLTGKQKSATCGCRKRLQRLRAVTAAA